MRLWTICLLSCAWAWSAALADDWIDPTDMRRFSGSLKRQDPQKDSQQELKVKGDRACSKEEAACPHFVLRFLNLLLKGANLESLVLGEESVHETWMKLEVRGRDLRLLKEFASGSRPLDLLHINDIMSDILLQIDQKSPSPPLSPELAKDLPPSPPPSSSYMSPISFFVFLASSLIFLFLYHVYSGYSYSSAACLLYIVIFLIVFSWESFRLYNEKVAQQKAELMKTEIGIPIECTPSRMSMWASFVNYFRSEDKCEAYFRKIDPHPLSGTDVGQAFSNTFNMMVYSVISGIGTVVREILGAISDRLIWPFNWILYIILVGLTVLYIFFRTTMSFTKVKFSSLFWSFEMNRNNETGVDQTTKCSSASSQSLPQNNATRSISPPDEADNKATAKVGEAVHFTMSPETFGKFFHAAISGSGGGGDSKAIKEQEEARPQTSKQREGASREEVLKLSGPPSSVPEQQTSSRAAGGGATRPAALSKRKKVAAPVFLRRMGRQTSF